MLQRIVLFSLMVLCGAGLLVSWMPDAAAWRIFELAIYSLLIVWLTGWLLGRAPDAAWSWLLLPAIGIAGWGILQLWLNWTVYRYSTFLDLLRWGVYAAILVLAFQTSGRQGDGRRFSRALAIYGSILALVSLVQYFSGTPKIFWLFTPGETASGLGPFLNRDHFASFAALALPAAAWEMLRQRDKWGFALAMATLYAAVVAGASRAGFSLVTFEVVLLFILLGVSRRVAVATVALMTAFVLVVGWENLYDKMKAPDPYAGRREVVEATLRMIREHPWRGSGLGTWTAVYPAHASKDFGVFVNAAHNDWLQWASDGGIPFVSLFLVLFVGSVFVVRRVPWALGVPIVFLHSAVDFPMQGHFLPATVFLVLGVAARAATHEKQDGSNGERRAMRDEPRQPRARKWKNQ